jgi:hypothetical protein
MKKLLYFNFKKFLRSIWFKSNNYKLYLNLSATLLHKVSRSRFLHITSLALLAFILLSTSCNTNEPQVNDNDLNKWKRISEFDGMDVKGFKIINDELYVYGWGDNNGLYKTSDGNNWTKINLPNTGNFEYGVSAITMRDQELVVAPAYSYYKRLCKVDVNGGNEIIPTEISIEISDMEVLVSNIIIVPSRMPNQYNMGVLNSNGELKLIADSIYTNPYTENECYKTNGIRQTGSSKLIKTNNIIASLLSGELLALHFIIKIDTNGYHCFSTKGITTDDKFVGVYDLAWYRDTLFAATQSYIKFFANEEWKVYKDSLPTPHGTVPFVTSFTFYNNTVYVATPSDGVLEWKDNKWNSLGDGLPQNKEQKIYPGISWIIAFNNNLFIGFGTGKVWDTGMRGVWKYSLNN